MAQRHPQVVFEHDNGHHAVCQIFDWLRDKLLGIVLSPGCPVSVRTGRIKNAHWRSLAAVRVDDIQPLVKEAYPLDVVWPNSVIDVQIRFILFDPAVGDEPGTSDYPTLYGFDRPEKCRRP